MKQKLRFDIAISSYCQAKCPSCARTNPDTLEKVDWLKPSHINVDVFKNIVDSAVKMDPDVIFQFCGELGDPLMHPKIDELIDYAMERSNGVEVNTNGGLRSSSFFKEMAEKWECFDDYSSDAKMLKFIFGIDGMTAETSEKYRIAVDWERAITNMETWADNGGRGEWHFIIFEHNWHEIPAAIKLAEIIDYPIFFKFNGRNYGMISDHGKREAYRMLEELDGEIVP